MNKKQFYIYLGIGLTAAIAGIVLIILVFTSGNNSSPQVNEFVFNAGNQPIATRDFISSADSKFDSVVVLYASSDASIQFDRKNRFFQITYYADDFESFSATRDSIESIFLERLDISKPDACLLNVTEVALQNLSNEIGKETFGMSFCADGKVFPVAQNSDDPQDIR